MALERPSPTIQLALVWLVLPLLLFALSSVRTSMIEGWEAQPPTDVEATDCRLDAMMGGENAVEVERIDRECRAAAKEAFVQPRVRRITLIFALLGLVYAAGATGLTLRLRASGDTAT